MSTMQMEENQAGAPGPGPYGASDRAPLPGSPSPIRPAGQDWAGREQSLYATRRKSPVFAAILSLLPGLGQVYVGYYMRGFIHIIVVASTITILANGARSGNFQRTLEIAPLLGLFLAFFWIYNMIDASRVASFYNEALLGARPGDLKKEMTLPGSGGSLAGGIILLGVGLLLLLNTMFDVSLFWIREWWPMAPVGFGIYLIVQSVKDRRRKN